MASSPIKILVGRSTSDIALDSVSMVSEAICAKKSVYLYSLPSLKVNNRIEKFNETIKSRHRDRFSYASFSEGEKQRIDLSLLFTWRQIAKMKNSVATNLLVLDETFDSSLDTDGVDNLLKILQSLGEDTNVFVISHKGELEDASFNRKIEFVKERNFSKIRP